ELTLRHFALRIAICISRWWLWPRTRPLPGRCARNGPTRTVVPANSRALLSRHEQLCLKSPKSFLDRVSTGSGSDLVKRWKSGIVGKSRTRITDQVATAPCTDPIQVAFPFLRQSSQEHKMKSLQQQRMCFVLFAAKMNQRF